MIKQMTGVKNDEATETECLGRTSESNIEKCVSDINYDKTEKLYKEKEDNAYKIGIFLVIFFDADLACLVRALCRQIMPMYEHAQARCACTYVGRFANGHLTRKLVLSAI